MSAHRFLVEPIETVVFGQPRSFIAGEAHRTKSDFPPSPFAFQGLVRSQLLRGAVPLLDLDDWSDAARAERAALVGGPDALPQGWQLKGPYPARWVRDEEGEFCIEPWVPAPRFLLRHGNSAIHLREVRSTHPGLDDLGADRPLYGRPGLGNLELLGGWVGPEILRFALAGERRVESRPVWQWAAGLPPFVHNELQPGLALDRCSATARHGLLYFLGALRFEERSGLFGSLRATLDSRLRPEAIESGLGAAGRKGRAVRFHAVERLHPTWERIVSGDHLPEEPDDGACFWLLTLTPVPGTAQLRLAPPPGVHCEVVAKLAGPPRVLGGYRMDTARARPNQHYFPAGSAWLFQVTGGTSADRRACIHQLHDAHPFGPPEQATFGFGHTLVGIGPATTEEGP